MLVKKNKISENHANNEISMDAEVHSAQKDRPYTIIVN